MKQTQKTGRIATAIVLTAALAFGVVGCKSNKSPLVDQPKIEVKVFSKQDGSFTYDTGASGAGLLRNNQLVPETKPAETPKKEPAEKPPVAPGVQTYPGKGSSISG